MALLVEDNEPLDPVAIGLFGAEAEVPEAGNVPHLFNKSFLGHVMHNTAFGAIIERF
jgi:hypothetical protein